ncbi:MAG TPA: radical SAM family heme chaperone HemW [Victivallales bacterium]|nr:radical SAM family heme chaperone HemW [Victivallales bacterium]
MSNINRIYIHIPFCSSKCDYCAFHSTTDFNKQILIEYFKVLENNIQNQNNKTTVLDSIFIGGGTPSILPETYIEHLFSLINKYFIIADTAEISIELNPESLTEEKIKIISNHVNRISLGIQTFNEIHRKTLGRKGKINSIYKSIEQIFNTDISNVSCDFIYGIPGQKLKDLKSDIDMALQYPFKHMSAYSLTFEENTKLSNKILNCNLYDKISSKMWEFLPHFAQIYNLNRYEISNYSVVGYECKHNLDTWFGGKYLGFGPTASSFDGINRWTQPKLIEWVKGVPSTIDKLPINKRIKEIFIIGLRTSDGWILEKRDKCKILYSPFSATSREIKFPNNLWDKISPTLERLKDQGLLNLTEMAHNILKIQPTEKGMLFWNEIGVELI